MHERHFGSTGERARTVERNSAEAKRRERAGIRSPGGRGVATLVWQTPPRNGMPVRFYVYRGTGEDPYAALYLSRDELEAAIWRESGRQLTASEVDAILSLYDEEELCG